MTNFFEKEVQAVLDRALNIIQQHKAVLTDITFNLKRNEAGLNIITPGDLPEPGEWFRIGASMLECGAAEAIILEKSPQRTVAYVIIAAQSCCLGSTTNAPARITPVYGTLLETFTQQTLGAGQSGSFDKGQPRQFTALEDTAYIWTLQGEDAPLAQLPPALPA